MDGTIGKALNETDEETWNQLLKWIQKHWLNLYHIIVLLLESRLWLDFVVSPLTIHFIPQWLFGSENKSFPANAVSVSSSSHCSHAKQNTQMDQNAVANLFIIMLYFCLHFVSFQLTWFHFEIIGKI